MTGKSNLEAEQEDLFSALEEPASVPKEEPSDGGRTTWDKALTRRLRVLLHTVLLAQMREPTYGMVGYGGGTRLGSSIAHLSTLGRPLETIHYVGDLDFRGLQIAASAKKAAQAAGLPTLTAAPGMHAAMLRSCERFGHPKGWPVQRGTDSQFSPSVDKPHLSFLPAEVREAACAIIDYRRRVPEEVLGPDEMQEVWVS